MSDDDPNPVAKTVKVRIPENEYNEVFDHINRKALSPIDACPVCGSENNTVSTDVYRVDVLSNPAIFGGEHQPLISTICNNCGFVRFFNRNIVKYLIEEEKSQTENLTKKSEDGS